MIPVTVIGNDGKIVGQQAFNDNLTSIEEFNRIMLATINMCKDLINTKTAVEAKISDGSADADAYLKKAEVLNKAIGTAIDTFNAAD